MAVRRGSAPAGDPGHPEGGFALLELIVALAIFTFGVLGAVSFVDGASSASGQNRAREGATALAREVLETARAVPYRSLTSSGATTALQGRSALADSSPAAGYTVRRRGIVYTLSVTVCVVDDPKDGAGPHDGGLEYCPDSAAAGSTDRVSDDYRRIAAVVSWARDGKTTTTRQTGVVSNPAGGLGPSVDTLALRSQTSPVTQELTSVDVDLTTSATPASVTWSVNGDPKGSATGSNTSWSFAWPIGTYNDGTYVVQAQAFDEEGRSGLARKLTVVLNRTAPAAPTGFAGGRNGTPGHVDLEWHANPEGDVVGYRIYRSDAAGTPGERACPPAGEGAGAVLQQLTCVDEGAAATGTIHYVVKAVDLTVGGSYREGSASAPITVEEPGAAPSVPSGVTLCSGGDPGCNGPDGLPAPTGTTALSWSASNDTDGTIRFYRVLRDGVAYADRYDRLYPGSGALVYVDRAPGGSTHAYRVVAVDDTYLQSAASSAVTG
ncbi:MAG TPA: prepilin-type N-terminal cleavage/methylation domain-containing protein [Thermoleophilaceae bacterium]|nr:prepilin-type N-terminal cleavage/methylation domain-containing protein [Thermoleophilaceae bacterium]